MTDRPSRSTLIFAFAAMAACALVAVVLVLNLPEVVGLGSRVKLPIFHGASTWVDLMLFVAMGVASLVYLVSRSHAAYQWEVGLKAVAMPLWVLNSVLGFVAALGTWDFTGSKQSPLVVIRSDPRLTAQVLILLGVAIIAVLDWLVLEKRVHKAVADLIFVAGSSVLLSDIFLDPAKRALHPDSPVLNSGWDIKGPFFGIVASWLACMLIGSWLARHLVRREELPTEK